MSLRSAGIIHIDTFSLHTIMPQFSDQIAVIVSALARAQAELIQSHELAAHAQLQPMIAGDDNARGPQLTISSDAIRLSFSRQNIAIIQATRTNEVTGHIHLTTLLAHTSGEWISSELPVLADLTTLEEIERVLTDARRRAVLALIGLLSNDDTAIGLKALANLKPAAAIKDDNLPRHAPINPSATFETLQKGEGALAFPKEPARKRSKVHLAFVRARGCLVCQKAPADAHHLKFAQPSALSRKVSDEFTVPLCRLHHQSLHRHGNERAWWKNLQLDPLSVAAALWAESQAHSGSSRDIPEQEGVIVQETEKQ